MKTRCMLCEKFKPAGVVSLVHAVFRIIDLDYAMSIAAIVHLHSSMNPKGDMVQQSLNTLPVHNILLQMSLHACMIYEKPHQFRQDGIAPAISPPCPESQATDLSKPNSLSRTYGTHVISVGLIMGTHGGISQASRAVTYARAPCFCVCIVAVCSRRPVPIITHNH